MKELRAILKEIGLTEGEIEVYTALLHIGSSTTGPIIDKSSITASKVYIILEKLEKKGLVSHVIKNNVKNFQASDPASLLNFLEKKKTTIEESEFQIKKLLPEIRTLRTKIQTLQETTMYEGFKGFQSAMREFIADMKAGEEFLVFGSSTHFGKEYERFIKHFYEIKESSKINTRLIYNSNFKEVSELYQGLHFAQVRFVDQILPSTIVIRDSKVLLIAYGEDSIQVLIQSDAIAQGYVQFFESVWQIGKE
jgi:sugar-specific transcriptional regulator TrmB